MAGARMGARQGMRGGNGSLDEGQLESLTAEQVLCIDRALAGIGAFGEVRIVKAKGRVRFIETLESRDLLKIGHDGRGGG
jgi:hypothetical protein